MASGSGRPADAPPEKRRRQRVSAVGVLGELLVTAGVLVLLFLGWQLWLGDIIVGAGQSQQARSLEQTWEKKTPISPMPFRPDQNAPIVGTAPANAVTFATIYVPRWGSTWSRPIAQGVGVQDVLDKVGVGHYPGTQMPGQVGNFAIAAHRRAYGGGFQFVHELHVGDSIYIGTVDGWYEYVFRDIQYVQPSQVNVLQPVPMQPGVAPTDRIITLTTCNPYFSTRERMISYGLFTHWYPRADGPPAPIKAAVAAGGS